MILIFFLFLFLPFSSSTYVHKTTFNFTSFNPNMHDIVYEGDASIANQVIELNLNQQDSLGRVTYKEPMRLWDKVSGNLADFTTHFSFAIDSQGRSLYGDGFAFFLASNGSTLQNGSGGGDLGLLDGDKAFGPDNYSFVAVEFDTFFNDNSDPFNVTHVGIDLKNIRSVTSIKWSWSDIKDGRIVEAWVSYNSSSKNLSVLLVDGNDTRNFSSFYYIVDLRNFLPEWVILGFSGSTGVAFEMHKICNWDLSSSLQVADEDPIHKKNKLWWWAVLLIVVGAVSVFALVSITSVWFFCCNEREGEGAHTPGEIIGTGNHSARFTRRQLWILRGSFLRTRNNFP